ncbi:hypothetical protein [Staphylococcus xylosus]|uniref:hypothetical protein n=1 Tax=Staphylococcus xylosus TaxID=1288 RepID=UPI000D1D21C6|nr:hypothetical protein [Staphylococcus xylosus]PTI64213.1 hypothetical protein BU095_06355 [Staphylococcus xylosus]
MTEETEIIVLSPNGEPKYVKTHWLAITGIPYANTRNRNGQLQDGIVTYQDKSNIDKYIKSQGIVLTSPNGSQFLITVDNNGKLGTVPFL